MVARIAEHKIDTSIASALNRMYYAFCMQYRNECQTLLNDWAIALPDTPLPQKKDLLGSDIIGGDGEILECAIRRAAALKTLRIFDQTRYQAGEILQIGDTDSPESNWSLELARAICGHVKENKLSEDALQANLDFVSGHTPSDIYHPRAFEVIGTENVADTINAIRKQSILSGHIQGMEGPPTSDTDTTTRHC